jgi:type I restriction enzyme S subunit
MFIEAITCHDQSLGVPHISPSQVEAIEIPMPSISEQYRIAAIAKEIFSNTFVAQKASSDMKGDLSILPSRLLAQAFGEA